MTTAIRLIEIQDSLDKLLTQYRTATGEKKIEIEAEYKLMNDEHERIIASRKKIKK